MATADQNAALQSALARAKEIAAKLAAGAGASAASSDSDDSRKRALSEQVAAFNGGEPFSKRSAMDDPNDPKALARQVAQTLVNRAGLGSMSSGFQEEMSIPNRYVGLVIGRGGEMINKLQVDTNARVQVAPDPVPDSSGNIPDRQLTITGTPEAVSKAKAVIKRIVDDGKVPDSMNMTPGEFVIEHMIPSQKIGLVIGKGGETIRGLQERAGCKMVLIQDGQFAERDEKPLRITGDPEKCQFGKQMVIDLLTAKEIESKQNDGPLPDRKNMDGTITTEHLVPKEAVGFVIGKSGETIKTIQDKSECKVQFKNDMLGSSKAAVLTGTPAQIEAAKALIADIVDNGNRPRGGPGGQRDDRDGGGFGRGGDGGGFPRGGGGGGGGGERPSRMPSTPLKPGEKMMDIKVPKQKCGLIIGKGGETIRMISEECEIYIEMNRTVPEEAPFRVFSMRGFRPKIQQAEEIIRDKIGDRTCQAVEVASGPPENGQSNQFGAPPQQPWGQQPQQQAWGGQPPSAGGNQPWNQQQPPQQQAPWQQPQQPWEQQQPAASWQQQQPQQPWQQPQAGQQQPPWQQQQQPQAQPQWPAAAQPQPAPAPAPAAQPTADAAAPAAGGAQPDYTQAWEAYYQQYYQQFGATAATAATSAAATAATAAPAQPAVAAPAAQPAAAAAQPDYTKAWEQYYQVHGYPAGYTATLAAGGAGAAAAQPR